MKKVTIVGAGFGALTAVRTIRKLKADVEITLVAPRPYFVYLPSIIWIPSGIRQPKDMVIQLDNFFKKHNVKYHQGSATGVSEAGRVLKTDNGDIKNDALIIASGGQFIKKLPGIEHVITPCEGVDAGMEIRDRLKAMLGGTIAIGFGGNPKEPSAMRGGPMFEFLFGIDSQLRKEKRRDKFKLVFFTPAPKPGARLGPKAVKGILTEMKKRDIETHLGHKMKGFTENSVITEGGEFVAELILFMPGMTGNSWFNNTELPRSPGGLIQGDKHCRVAGWDKTYVVGDSGSFPGPDWLPKQAHMADLQAEAAAKNMVLEFAGKTPTETYKAELMCIVDSHTQGMLITRTEKRSIVLPANPAMHWAKRIFEKQYLKKYR
ncbi:MAG TPA: pyridine nucleotide-disulfide oxidoreductase [Gammaproteobacteria bacterium]|nr:pyridine nucleotide-disulfide oxidoreductase [Gammaproteobacteria bacterium]